MTSRVSKNSIELSDAALLTGAAVMLGPLGGPGGDRPPGGVWGRAPLSDPIDLELSLDSEDLVPAIQTTLPEVEDRRLYHPMGHTAVPLRRPSSAPVRIKVFDVGQIDVPAALSVPAEASVIMCIRRKARRGVLLALGQGGGYHRKPRRNSTSNIWC